MRNKKSVKDEMTFEHVGVAVRDMAGCLAVIRKSFRSAVIGRIYDDRLQNVKIGFVKLPGIKIELVAPLDAKKRSPVDSILNNRMSYYHLSFSVSDIDSSVAEMVKTGATRVVGPIPAAAYQGRDIAFLFTEHLGLVELIQTPGKKRR